MQRHIFRIAATGTIFAAFVFTSQLCAQEEAAKLYKTNCNEVQAKSDSDLSAVISKGKGKMPAFGTKLKSDEIKQMVAYVRQIGRAK